MICFVLWLKYPAPSQRLASQEPPVIEAPPLDLQSFLDVEEGSATSLVSLPQSTHFEGGKKKQFIPLNVVPQQKSQQSPKVQIVATKRSASKRQGISSNLRKQLEQSESNADQLVGQSTDAFSRGLLSLSEYHLALNIGFDTKLKAAEIRQTKQANISFLNQKQQLFQQAVEQLQAFDQPAAQGWYGDLVHARLLLAQNQYEIADATKNIDRQQAALSQISNLSREYFNIRKAELQIGEADLSEFRRASRAVYLANQESQYLYGRDKNDTAGLSVYVRELEEIQTELQWMANRDAGMGRNDLLSLSKSHLAYTRGKYYQKKDHKNESRKYFQESMQYSQDAWKERINVYYPAGTASLHDLTSAWIMWNASGTEYTELESRDSGTINREIQAGLDQMLNIAERIRDRRGRMASDISLVRCLKNSEMLKEFKVAQTR
ncbi:hypothetical protein Pan241w_23420 [Gimesia alba]|uniref:Uncharacterized protein n=2 Tax=Gimesia alba TaxID=2527973 RepID=A0A517REI6_9PLAN|nr:hypothetical protein Pan241w_23420 [Gimesia alba]